MGFERSRRSRRLVVDFVVLGEGPRFIQQVMLDQQVELSKNTTQFFCRLEEVIKFSLAKRFYNICEKRNKIIANGPEGYDWMRYFCETKGVAEEEDISVDKNPSIANETHLKVGDFTSMGGSAMSKEGKGFETSLISREEEGMEKETLIMRSRKRTNGDLLSGLRDLRNKVSMELQSHLRGAKELAVPEQIMFLADWQEFTARAEIHIEEKKLSKLKKECKKRQTQLIRVWNRADQSEVPRAQIESALERAIWQEEIVAKIQSKKISDPSAFEWAAQPKYHVVDSVRSETAEHVSESPGYDTLLFSVCDSEIEYGFEPMTLSSVRNLAATGLLNVFREELFINFAFQFTSRSRCVLTGDVCPRNAALTFATFAGAPLTISGRDQGPRNLHSYLDFLVQSIEFGGVHLFEGLERPMAPEFMSAVCKTLDMLSQAVNRNQLTVELFDRSIEIPKGFLFIGGFDSSSAAPSRLRESPLLNLRNQFRELTCLNFDSQKLIQMILTKNGFSKAKELAPKVRLLFESISERVLLSDQKRKLNLRSLLVVMKDLQRSRVEFSNESSVLRETFLKSWIPTLNLSESEASEVTAEVNLYFESIKEKQDDQINSLHRDIKAKSKEKDGLAEFKETLSTLKKVYGIPLPSVRRSGSRALASEDDPAAAIDFRTFTKNTLDSPEDQFKISEFKENELETLREEPEIRTSAQEMIQQLDGQANLLRPFGASLAPRPIVLVGQTFTGKSKLLRELRASLDSERGGHTRVMRLFPGVLDFTDLFGDLDNLGIPSENQNGGENGENDIQNAGNKQRANRQMSFDDGEFEEVSEEEDNGDQESKCFWA